MSVGVWQVELNPGKRARRKSSNTSSCLFVVFILRVVNGTATILPFGSNSYPELETVEPAQSRQSLGYFDMSPLVDPWLYFFSLVYSILTVFLDPKNLTFSIIVDETICPKPFDNRKININRIDSLSYIHQGFGSASNKI